MLGFDGIIAAINKLFGNVRPPQKQVNRMLLVCSLMKRPGLSVIQSVANITQTLSMLGIPTEKMPDGSDNKTIQFAYAIVKEIYRALKMDASVQMGFVPGSLSSLGVGANAGGAMTVVSKITNPGQGVGAIF